MNPLDRLAKQAVLTLSLLILFIIIVSLFVEAV